MNSQVVCLSHPLRRCAIMACLKVQFIASKGSFAYKESERKEKYYKFLLRFYVYASNSISLCDSNRNPALQSFQIPIQLKPLRQKVGYTEGLCKTAHDSWLYMALEDFTKFPNLHEIDVFTFNL